jgi:hypothetical protein
MQNSTQQQNNFDNPRYVTPVSGTGEVTKNRNLSAVVATHPGTDATNTMKWTAEENVRAVTVSGIALTVAGPVQNDEAILVLFDALNAPAAKALLEDSGGAEVDIQYDILFVGQKQTYVGDSYFTRLDTALIGIATARLLARAN